MNKSRVPIRIILKKSGQVSKRSTFKKRGSVYRFIEAEESKGWDSGRVLVMYNSALDYYNVADFTNITQFKSILTDFMDKQLIEEYA